MGRHGIRSQAVKLGQEIYFTDGPCKNGHFSPRWTYNGKCQECQRAKNRRSYHHESTETRRAEYQRRRQNHSRHLAHAIGCYLRKGIKTGNLKPRLGYSLKTLRTHLERQFLPGMSWANYGTKWHIDHRIPLKSFPKGDPKAWEITNLQPLWAKKNLEKGSKRIYLL